MKDEGPREYHKKASKDLGGRVLQSYNAKRFSPIILPYFMTQARSNSWRLAFGAGCSCQKIIIIPVAFPYFCVVNT